MIGVGAGGICLRTNAFNNKPSPVPGNKKESTYVEQKVPAWSPDGKWIAHWEGEYTTPAQNLAQFNLAKNRLGRALFRVAAGLPFPCSLPSQIGGSQSHPLKTLLSKSQFPRFLFPQSNSIRFRLFAVPLFTANSHSRPICKPMSRKVPTPILTQITYDTFRSSVANSVKIFKVFINFNCGVQHEKAYSL